MEKLLWLYVVQYALNINAFFFFKLCVVIISAFQLVSSFSIVPAY